LRELGVDPEAATTPALPWRTLFARRSKMPSFGSGARVSSGEVSLFFVTVRFVRGPLPL
jgi:hypothetical protein